MSFNVSYHIVCHVTTCIVSSIILHHNPRFLSLFSFSLFFSGHFARLTLTQNFNFAGIFKFIFLRPHTCPKPFFLLRHFEIHSLRQLKIQWIQLAMGVAELTSRHQFKGTILSSCMD